MGMCMYMYAHVCEVCVTQIEKERKHGAILTLKLSPCNRKHICTHIVWREIRMSVIHTCMCVTVITNTMRDDMRIMKER